MTDLRRWWVFAGILALLLILTVCAGCARLRRGTPGAEETGAVATKEAEVAEPIYYDFEDVLVPVDLKLDKKKSFVYHTPGVTAGVLVLSGRVEVNSLARFFENNMAKDNWRLLSVFKIPRTIMFFQKPNRICVINITEQKFTTEVEISVAPTIEGEEATVLE